MSTSYEADKMTVVATAYTKDRYHVDMYGDGLVTGCTGYCFAPAGGKPVKRKVPVEFREEFIARVPTWTAEEMAAELLLCAKGKPSWLPKPPPKPAKKHLRSCPCPRCERELMQACGTRPFRGPQTLVKG